MRFKKILCLVSSLVFTLSAFSACGGGNNGSKVKYPDYPLASADSDSWTQVDASDQVAINWYVDIAGWNSQLLSGDSVVARKIREKTGVTVNFIVPLNDTGDQLSTLISANRLPDVVTLNKSSAEQKQLSSEGYLYPIDGLVERWAPTMKDRIHKEIRDFYSMGDGQLYGIPHDFYTSDDLKAYEQQGGYILPNGTVAVRKDYLDAYLTHAAEQNLYSSYVGTKIGNVTLDTPRKAAEYAVTRADNFAEMCKWVKTKFAIPNADQTILLNPFNQRSQTYTGNKGIKWLYEYFNVRKETPDGNLPNMFEDENLKELMNWLNYCYRSNLITDLGLTSSQVGQQVGSGKAFCFIGSAQDFTKYFADWNYNHPGKEYIPVVLTNSKGETPQLTNLCANGFHISMITRNCSRPDRVIKLFDFLLSQEGQELVYFGTEGTGADDTKNTFYYTVRPGETVNGITYKYGQMKWTNHVQEAYDKRESTSLYGTGSMYLLGNRMYAHMGHPAGEYLNGYYAYTNHNMKAALTPYSFNAMYLDYMLDVTASNYSTMITKEAQINEIWYMDYFIQIIKARSEKQANDLFEEAYNYVKSYGYSELLEYQNASFKARKALSNVTYAWPPNDPNSGYANLKVTSIYGDQSYTLEIPDGVEL